MFGGQSAQKSGGGNDPLADNPLGKMFKDMLGGGAQPEPAREPPRAPSGAAKSPYDDVFGKMFESGREVQSGYQKNMESIFDQYLDGMKRNK